MKTYNDKELANQLKLYYNSNKRKIALKSSLWWILFSFIFVLPILFVSIFMTLYIGIDKIGILPTMFYFLGLSIFIIVFNSLHVYLKYVNYKYDFVCDKNTITKINRWMKMIKIKPNLPYKDEQLNENNLKYKITSIKRLISIILVNWLFNSISLTFTYFLIINNELNKNDVFIIFLSNSLLILSINLLSFIYWKKPIFYDKYINNNKNTNWQIDKNYLKIELNDENYIFSLLNNLDNIKEKYFRILTIRNILKYFLIPFLIISIGVSFLLIWVIFNKYNLKYIVYLLGIILSPLIVLPFLYIKWTKYFKSLDTLDFTNKLLKQLNIKKIMININNTQQLKIDSILSKITNSKIKVFINEAEYIYKNKDDNNIRKIIIGWLLYISMWIFALIFNILIYKIGVLENLSIFKYNYMLIFMIFDLSFILFSLFFVYSSRTLYRGYR
ncbi:Uncharacterised protein [Mycoplasmopsis maculosa]|uniref:Uncharacterized protein n=1 Tax=Mycoplasmopsis maculosa TaxID=114885 RepID=A0A449B582_9BACT|nr:hypothetical protein [Mycoplasmopsis maculosa]VEU75725.1 Uncharacterised protein [Mycoplasmopsis maculosa]